MLPNIKQNLNFQRSNMRSKASIVALRTLLLLLAVAPAIRAAEPASPIAEQAPAPQAPPAGEKPAAAQSQPNALDLTNSVTQLMFVTMQGFQGPDNSDRTLLKRCAPGGIVIPSVLNPGQAAHYVKTLRSMPNLEHATGIPLFIASDLYQMTQTEDRLPVTFAQLPSLLSIGAVADTDATTRLAKMLAQHLTAMGFNMNIGPSLELAPTITEAPGDTNTFGSNPKFAARAGAAIVKTLLEGGVIPVPTGFPGGGHDRRETSPAALLTPKTQLANRELLPFRAAIEAGAPVIHVANTLVPLLDPENRPACLSPEVYRMLREDMNFDGLIIAGPVDSPDVARFVEPEQAAVLAFQAGADMIYWAGHPDMVLHGAANLAIAVNTGHIPPSRLQESLQRILALKKKLNLAARPIPDEKDAGALERKKVANEAYELERKSITLIKNDGGILPLSKEHSMPVGVTGVVGVEQMTDALEQYIKPVHQQPILTAKHLGEIQDFEINRLTAHVRGLRTAICVFTGMRQSFGEARLIRELKAHGVRVVVLLLGYPKNLPQLADADAIMLAYCDKARYAQSIRAAADIIAGVSPFQIAPAPENLTIQAGNTETFDARKVIRAPLGKMPVDIGPFDSSLAADYMPTLKKIRWDFGDGKKSNDPRTQHAYKKPGQYTLTLTVTNPHGEKASREFPITVN